MEVDLGGENLQVQKVGWLAWAGAWSLKMCVEQCISCVVKCGCFTEAKPRIREGTQNQDE